MKCAFCGLVYEEEQAALGCQGCGLFGGCHLVKCPRCGYEQPKEPTLLKWWRQWRARQTASSAPEKG